MFNIPIPVIGPTYSSRSAPVSNQTTRNFYPEVTDQSENTIVLQPFPGLKSFGSAGSGLPRGLGIYNNELYAVNGSSLYKVDSSGVATDSGSISGVGRCKLEEASSSLVITTGSSKPYEYNGTLTLGTDADLPNAAVSTYIKNRVVYDGDGTSIVFADLGSPLSVNSANVTSDDTKPDNNLSVFAFKDQLFSLNEQSITPYYNSGVGNPPYSVIQNSVQGIGIAAAHTAAANYRSFYFLGSDLNVYRVGGLQPEPIGNPAIVNEIRKYGNVQNAFGKTISFNGQHFYFLTFPGHASWLYTEGLGWTSLAYGQDGDPHLIYDYAYVYNKHIVQDRRNGNLYELDLETYTDNGDSIDHQRDTIKISGKELGYPGKEIFMDKLRLVVESGVGTATGQGVVPRVMMSFSDDGGRTWSPEQWDELGEMGDFEYERNPYWSDLGSFYERQFRFRVSDPVKVVIISANAEISVGV